MKLHLPKSLRGALLACFASLAGLSSTLATGAMLGGAFYVSLSQVAQAEEVAITTVTTNTIWSNEAAEGHAGEEVTVDGGDTAITLQVGQGGTNEFDSIAEEYRSMDFGTVTVNAGDTLKLWTWTGTTKDLGSTNKVAIESAITLNQAQLRIEDGSYYFAGAITITGTSSIRTQYAKGISLANIDGDENAVLELVRGIGTSEQKDTSRAVFELTEANEDFSGTVKLVDDNGTPNVGAKDGLQLVLSNTNALVNAVLDFGETEDVTLALNTSKVLLKAIKGHGFVEYYNSTSTVGEIELTAAAGTFSGTSAANVNWIITRGNQSLSNASILGTYTVGESATSTFSGNVTLGSLVNNSTAGINVANLTHLRIADQTVGDTTVLNLGTLSGYTAGNTFTYGNGWTATWKEDGTATISTDHIFWNDNGTDGNTNWSDSSNWVAPGANAYTVQSTDTVYLHDVAAGKTVTLTEDVTVAGLHVEGDYSFAVAQGKAYTLTAPITLASNKTFTKSGNGTLKLSDAFGLLGKNITVEAGILDITEVVDLTNGNDNTQASYTVTVKAGAKLKDGRRLGLTGNTVTITGGGIYELAEMVLSRENATAKDVTLNVEADTVLHVTGTYNSNDTGRDSTGKKGGSFMLGNWPATNTLNLRGVLAAEAGISLATGSVTLNIENGGVLQMNAGLKTTSSSGSATISVKNGGALVVQSSNTGGEDKMTVNMQDGSTVFAIDDATIAEPLVYAASGSVKLGAAADTILTLTAAAPNVGTITILGSGDTVKTFADDAVSQTAAGGTVKYNNAVNGTAITLNEGAKFEAAAGLNLSGALTLAANAEAKLGGAITLGSLVNNSTTGIDVTNMTSLTINNQQAYQGATITGLGTLTGLSADNTFTYGNGWLATYDSASGTATLSDNSSIYWVDVGGVDDTDNDWASASNWQGGAVPTSSDTVRLGADAANKTIAFSANASIGQARVAEGDYTFTTDSDVTLAGTVSVASVGASLSKAGQGTLTLTDVMANALNVTEGALVVNSLRVYSGETFTKMGTGGLTLTSVSANALSVSAGSMNVNTLSLISGDTFTKSGAGTLAVGTLNANQATVSAGLLSADTATLKSGNTFTKAGEASMELGTTNASTLSVSAGDLKMTAWALAAGATANKSGAGTLTIGGDTSALKGNLDVRDGNVTFEADASFGTLAVHEKYVYIGTESKNVDVVFTSSTYNGFSGHMSVAAGSTLTAGSVTANNSTYRLHGAGVYNIGQLTLATSNEGNLAIDDTLTVNVTGTTTDGTTNGSFVLGGSKSTISVNGTLTLASGISATANSTNHVVNVGNGANMGATLWLKDGLWAAVAENVSSVATINVKSGSHLVVDGTNTHNTDKIKVNLADGSTVFTTTGGTILNAMAYTGTVKLGAAAGSTLNLTNAAQTNVTALTILGTTDAVNEVHAGGGVAFTGKVSGASVTLNAGGQLTAAAGLNLSGALTLAANSEAKLSGTVSLGSLANSGTIDVSGLQSLRLGADTGSMGATVNIGTVSSYTEGSTFTYGNGWTATWQDNGTAVITADAAIAWADVGADDNINWNEATNWSSSAVPAATEAVRLTADNAGKTIALTDNATVQELRVYGAYTLSVGTGASYSLTATDGIHLMSETAGLSKTGAGTLAMTSANAIATKMNVTEGTLKLTDRLPGNGSAGNTDADVDFSSLTVSENAVLSIVGADRGGNSNVRTTVKLGESFTGALEVSGGWLDSDSALGNASLVVFNGGHLLARDTQNNKTISKNIKIAADTEFAHLGDSGNGVESGWKTTISGAVSGTGTIKFIENGDWYFTGDMSGFTGGLNQQSANMNIFLHTNAEKLASYTTVNNTTLYVGDANKNVKVTTATGRTQSGNFNLDVAAGSTFRENGILEQTGGTFVVKGGGAYETQHIALSAGTKLDVQGSSTVNLLGATDTTFTVSSGEIALATGATVNDSRALTIDGAYTISGAGEYKQLGSLALTTNSTLTFDGVGELALDGAIQNAGTVQFLDAANTQFVLSDALLTEDLTGVSKTWTLVEGGSVIGWDTDTLSLSQFTLNGTALSLDEWDGWSLENGKLTLTMLSRYWDATAAGAVWNTTDANWRPTVDSNETNVFETNSRVIFTDTDEAGTALQKVVAVTDAGVHAKSIVINDSGYRFSRGAVLVDQSIAATQDATFDSSLVIGSSTQELQIDVSEGATLSVGTLETLSEVKNGVSVYLQAGGSFRKTGAGTLSITDAVAGIINSVVVESGNLALDVDVALTVGSNVITGGVLSNVLLTPHGYVSDSTSEGRQVAAGNVITSADGANAAVLTNVNLQAGSATAYASLQNVSFAGDSSLSGFITFEKTKHQREMAVATNGSLKVENLTFDLHGLSIGEKVLIENGAVADAAAGKKGTITGWENITLTYSGVVVNAASVDKTVAGVVTIREDALKEDGGDLYWDGLGADGAADDNWNASSTNWNATEEGTDGSSVYYALSDTYFGATPQDAAKNINVAQDMVATNLYIRQGGYSFSGYRVATLADVVMNTTDAGAITFNNELVVQGSLTSHVAGELTFAGETSVVGDALVEAGSLNVSNSLTVMGDLTVNSGSTAQGGAGSMMLGTGASISAQNITLTVNAGASSDAGYADAKVDASGNISAAGTLTLNGNAAKNLTGSVTAHDIVVGTGVITNAVSFAQVAAEALTVGANSTVDLTADGAAGIKQINLAGALGYDKFAGNFWNYDVVSTSETASVTIASIAKVSMSSLSGADLGNGTYGSVVFNGGFRRLTIDNLYHVQNITFGSSEEGVHLTNATGQIYGDLTLEPGSSLTVSCNDIMANGQGAWSIEGTVNLGHTTQTLAGNTIMASAAVIRGDMYHQETQRDEVENVDVTVNVLNTGLNITENTDFSFTGNNTLSANMNVAVGKTLTLHAGRSNEDTITISGHLGGSGSVVLEGSIGMGTVSLAADNGYNGTMSVKNGMTLQLEHTGALSEATLHLDAGATLLVDTAVLGAPAEIASLNLVGTELVTLDGQQYNAGLIQVNNLAATESFSAADSAFMVGELQLAEALTLNLQLAFSEGGLQNMMTYNLFAADAGHSLQSLAEQLHLDLYVVGNGITNHVASNQYEVVYDAEQNVISLRTMLGHIWSGGTLDADGNGQLGDGIWSTDNPQAGNWSGKDYDESSGYTNAIFVDLEGHDGKQATVTIEGTVTPGDIYFEADQTYYNLIAAQGSGLAAGTNIHKAGEANVTLELAGNGTVENALGTMDIEAGILVLTSNLAVQGDISIGAEAWVRTMASSLVRKNYTLSGDYSSMIISGDAISGVEFVDKDGVTHKGMITSYLKNAVNIAAQEGTSVLLQNVTLASSSEAGVNAGLASPIDTLTNVTIGQNVDVTGYYALNGHITFEHKLANTGIVVLGDTTTVEIGNLGYSYQVVGDAATSAQYKVSEGGSYYVYQLIQGGTINGMDTLGVEDVYINGVNISTGLADGVATIFSSNDGSLTLSIGNATYGGNGELLSVDGSVGMPMWDDRWAKTDRQPGISRRYAGTDSSAVVTFAEGIKDDTDHYYYSSVVKAENANKVNDTNEEIVVTLSSAATGSVAAGGGSAAGSNTKMEMWLYDRSGFNTVVAGRYHEGAEPTNDTTQNAATHLLVNTHEQWASDQKEWVVGGSWNVEQKADSYVTVQEGNILTLVGGTYGANQGGDTHVYVDGGTIAEVFAGGYDPYKNDNLYGNVNNSNLIITGGTLGLRTDDVRKRVYGGSYYGTVSGNVNVVVEGNAIISELVGGGYDGSVAKDITLDLISGTITRVDAAGVGGSSVGGNVLVNLHKGFGLTEVYGGKQNSADATVEGNSTLFFADAGETYDMTSTTIQGFSHLSLADDTYVKLTTDGNHFGTDNASRLLTISGTGKVELIGSTDLARDITLVGGATLWINSDHVGNSYDTTTSRYTITATAGTTLEVTGRPNPEEYEGLTFWLDLAGHGVNDMGALYKAATGISDPSGKVAFPRVTFSDSASINTEASIYWIECSNDPSDVYLNGNTLTKIGDQSLVIYNADVVDNSAGDADTAVDGTFFVKEGTLGIGYGMRAAKTNVVLSQGTTLDIVAQGNNEATIGALSGSGSVVLDNTFTIHTSAAGSYGARSEWMTQGADKYGQFDSDAGFAYGVFSGSISGAQALSLSGDGTQYLSGNESSYSGGTHLYDSATLYLMGSTEGSMTKGSTTASGGVVGTGAIAWESDEATLYLGNGVQVFNNGTTNVENSTMVIGVEAAPKGDKLTNYVGANSKGADGALVYTIDGLDYVEVATHNLSSISCNGKYADGTIYQAGELIDRDKMLLVSQAEWDTATVSGFSAGGYNTATYSGVLSGNANLSKVGQGTLILDQTNTYTGTTTIEDGTLVLKGWAQIGGSKTSAALNVQQKTGSSLMLAYDGTYGDEITQITNDISINGTGDVRWKTEAATGEDTAALISTIGSGVSFALRGDISGDGNVLHAGAGTLVLSGDSTYTGGTHATTGVVEVQSAAGLGSGKVEIDATADLHATVEAGTTASRLTTAIKAADSSIQGDVVINGTADTERVLSMNTNGYGSSSTTLNDTGTLLVNGAGVQTNTALLKGTGTLAVSDVSGQGATAQADALMDFTGDFVVEGNNAKIEAKQGNFNGGSMSISGQNAKVTLAAGTATIAYGETLSFTSNGHAESANVSTAAALEAEAVTVDSGALLTVSNAATDACYNLANLAKKASVAIEDMLTTKGAGQNVHNGGGDAYTYHFDAKRAMNDQRAGAVLTGQGLTLNGGSRYETHMANVSLVGGALTLNTDGGKIALNLLTDGNVQNYSDDYTSQIVLFSDVSSVNLGDTPWGEANAITLLAALDGEAAEESNTIYSTLASNYFTGWNITDETYLVYDVGARVVYLDKAVPEPTTTTLSMLALAGLLLRRRRKM